MSQHLASCRPCVLAVFHAFRPFLACSWERPKVSRFSPPWGGVISDAADVWEQLLVFQQPLIRVNTLNQKCAKCGLIKTYWQIWEVASVGSRDLLLTREGGIIHVCFRAFCLLLAYEHTSRKRLDISDFSLLMITCSGLSGSSPMNSDCAACHTPQFPRADQSDDCFPAWRTMDSSDALKRPLNGWVVSKLKASVLPLRWWANAAKGEQQRDAGLHLTASFFFKSEHQPRVSLPLTSCTRWRVMMTSVSSLISF